MTYQILLFILAFIILFSGAHWTLDSGEKIGGYFRLSPLTIGALFLGLGTSLPELFVSHLAVWEGHTDMALGNILGSNMANICLIMGMTGILTRLSFDEGIRREFYWHLGATILLSLTCLRGRFDYWTCVMLIPFFCFYLYSTLQKKTPSSLKKTERLNVKDMAKLILGFAFLYCGGELLISSGQHLAMMMGISEYVLSAVFIAFGTSLPELVTSFLTWYQGRNTHLITGNIIGSNICNIAFVLGGLGIHNVSFIASHLFELTVLVALSLVLLSIVFLKKSFGRFEGFFFLMIYSCVIYVWIGIA